MDLPNIGILGTLSGTHSKAMNQNMIQFAEMFNRFTNLGITRFNWKNLPKGVNERYLNICLFFYGKVCFFEHDVLGLTALPFAWDGQPNIFYEPTSIRPFSVGYEGPQLEAGQFEIIRNNPTMTPTAYCTWIYAERLADILRTIDVALLQKKRPWAIVGDEKQKLTILNFFKEVADNEPLIIGAKNFDRGRDSNKLVEKLDLNNDVDLDSLWKMFQNFMNHLYTLYGIENNNVEKKERLISDEVNSNNMVTDLNLETQLKEYREGCKRVNEHWGTNIEVEATSIRTYDETGINQEGDGEDGPLYD